MVSCTFFVSRPNSHEVKAASNSTARASSLVSISLEVLFLTAPRPHLECQRTRGDACADLRLADAGLGAAGPVRRHESVTLSFLRHVASGREGEVEPGYPHTLGGYAVEHRP